MSFIRKFSFIDFFEVFLPKGLKYTISFMAFFLVFFMGTIDSYARKKDNYSILVITAFSPDTQRMGSFLSAIEKNSKEKQDNMTIWVESMFCHTLQSSSTWTAKLNDILKSYSNKEVDAVVLVGQEAWSSYLQLPQKPNIPCFSVYISENGVLVPTSGPVNPSWQPKSLNTIQYAISNVKSQIGGFSNVYDLKGNLNLIQKLYPKTKHIVFFSDNTYGGVSLQALVQAEFKKQKELGLTLVDMRKLDENEAAAIFKQLPSHTAVLIGTWRITKTGRFILQGALNKILATRPEIPAFSLTGVGIGEGAIGGYIPIYADGSKVFLDQFYAYMEDGKPFSFVYTGHEYRFDREQILKRNLDLMDLPRDAVFVNELQVLVQDYQRYLGIISIVLLVFCLFFAALLYLFVKVRMTKNTLLLRENDLIAAKEKAEMANKAQAAFFASMNHEIRTPLNAIVGYASILTDENIVVDKEEKAEFRKIIGKNSEFLLQIIQDVLYISRFEASKEQVNLTTVDINEMCHIAFSTAFNERKPNVNYVFAAKKETINVQADEKKLLQVLVNLMYNAYKFTDNGCIILDYEVRHAEKDILFSVTDTGCGIPADKKGLVFDRFKKLNEFKQGTGLGLSICRMNVALWKGEIWVDSDYEDGARFLFTLPIGLENADDV